MPLRSMRSYVIVALIPACGLISGCGSGGGAGEEKPPPTECERRLLAIGDAYVRATAKSGKPPQTVNDLLPFLKDRKDLGKVEDILKSPEDNQNFAIAFGSNLIGLKETGSDVPVVAFEKTGKGGQRTVLRGDRETLLMSESELRSAKFPEGFKLPF